ncbi:MAG: MarR family transcriptional regulator [Deltaproteobacteria bacterium]|nr:MarR family transcriptional regulator [Deltaproteobacteria bacterium]
MTNSDTSYKSDMSIDERVMMAILRVAERFKRESAAISKNYGLTFPQYNVLRILDASENGQNTIKNVNRIMLVSGANLTGITKRLEKMGFILKKNDPKDDRLKWLEITAKGRQVLKSISEEKELNMKKYVKQYSDEEKSKILSVMKGILKSE